MKNSFKKTIIISCLLTVMQAQSMSFLSAYFGNSSVLAVAQSAVTQPVQVPKSRFIDVLLQHCHDCSEQLWLSKCDSLYGLETFEQILQQAISENRLNIIKSMMSYVSKEDRGAALLCAVQSKSIGMVAELLKHKVSEKALWKSLGQVILYNHADRENLAELLLWHMKSLTLTERYARELLNSCDIDMLSLTILPSNMQNMIVKVLVKDGRAFQAQQFLNNRTVYRHDLTAVEQRGISRRVTRSLAKEDTTPAVAALIAKKFYEGDKIKTFRKFDIAMLQKWLEGSRVDFYKHYDSVRTGATCSSAIVDDVPQTAHLVHNFLLQKSFIARFMKQQEKSFGIYQPNDLPYDLIKTNMINRVCQLEKEFEAQGYQTFYHGRSWEWNFANDMWRMLCALKANAVDMPDIVALRYRTGQETSATLQAYRADLMANGPDNYGGTGTTASGKDAEITCMNRTILTNSSSDAICTGSYFLDNCSMALSGNALRYVEQMFKDHNMHAIYLKFESQIKDLAKEHHKTSHRGELLCIAVRKDCLDEMVYVSCGFGNKDLEAVTSKFLKEKQAKAISDPLEIEDEQSYFCFAVSDIPGEYGDKYMIKSLHNADPVKYAAYNQKLNSLFTDMKKQNKII